MLELKDVTLAVGDRVLQSRLSLIAADGQLTCICGPSGAGKTLLARVLAGFVAPAAGFVSIDGELLTPLSIPTFRRLMAYLPQQQPCAAEAGELRTDGFEYAWSPTLLPEAAAGDGVLPPAMPQLPLMSSKRVVIADDPDVSMLGSLKALTADDRVVIVLTRHEEYMNMSDKLITLYAHDDTSTQH